MKESKRDLSSSEKIFVLNQNDLTVSTEEALISHTSDAIYNILQELKKLNGFIEEINTKKTKTIKG